MRIVIAVCGTLLMLAGTTLAAEVTPADRVTQLGGQVTQANGVVTKITFKDCSKLGDAEFRLIGQLTDLTSLTLYGQCTGLTDATLPLLTGLTKLEELGTDRIQASDAGLALFASFTNVRSLAFFHTSFGKPGFDGSGFAALKTLPKLERLTIAGSPFNDRGLAAVASIKQLREFRTWHTYQTQTGNEYLTELPELKSLWLGQRLPQGGGKPNPLSLDDSTLPVLARLSKLESLTLDEARLSLGTLEQLKQLPKLKKLDLRRIDIAPEDVERLCAALPGVTIVFQPLTDEERPKFDAFLKVGKKMTATLQRSDAQGMPAAFSAATLRVSRIAPQRRK